MIPSERRRVKALLNAVEACAHECGYCGREGFSNDAIRVAFGEDASISPCPECARLVRGWVDVSNMLVRGRKR